MSKLDPYEIEVLEAYQSGKLKPTASKAELQRMRAAARATAIKDKRVNIRLSSIDLLDLQAKALEEGDLARETRCVRSISTKQKCSFPS